jgi:amidase
MRIDEYARHDALGLAELVKRAEITPRELANVAADAIAAINPEINAVIELYHDRVDLVEIALGSGPFRGVPFLIKDVGGHEKGRKIEPGSRLCAGLLPRSTPITRSCRGPPGSTSSAAPTPEFSMASSSGTSFTAPPTPDVRGRPAARPAGVLPR